VSGGVVFIMVLAVPLVFLGGLKETYLSSTWTLTYRELRALRTGGAVTYGNRPPVLLRLAAQLKLDHVYEEGPGIIVVARNVPPESGGFGAFHSPRIDGFTITAADVGGTLVSNAATVFLFRSTKDWTTNEAGWIANGAVTNLGPRNGGDNFTNTLSGLSSNTWYYWNQDATLWLTESASYAFTSPEWCRRWNGAWISACNAGIGRYGWALCANRRCG
jgi:hypothetical protein